MREREDHVSHINLDKKGDGHISYIILTKKKSDPRSVLYSSSTLAPPPRRRESHTLADISENEATSSEQAVINISAMFPTVDESHIRDLLRK